MRVWSRPFMKSPNNCDPTLSHTYTHTSVHYIFVCIIHIFTEKRMHVCGICVWKCCSFLYGNKQTKMSLIMPLRKTQDMTEWWVLRILSRHLWFPNSKKRQVPNSIASLTGVPLVRLKPLYFAMRDKGTNYFTTLAAHFFKVNWHSF